MYCRTCGKEVNQNAEFCLNCGVNPQSGNAHCHNCGVNTNPEQVVCLACGVNLEQRNVSNGYNSAESSKAFCKSCGSKVNDKAEICMTCGINPLNGHNYCQNCGAPTKAEQEICTSCGVRVSGVRINSRARGRESFGSTMGSFSYGSYSEYYQNEFSAIERSNEEYQGKFNWLAFLFTPIWLLTKGMWQLVLIVSVIYFFPLVGVLVALVFCFLIGRKANYLYYRKEKYGEQLPKDWSIFFDFINQK